MLEAHACLEGSQPPQPLLAQGLGQPPMELCHHFDPGALAVETFVRSLDALLVARVLFGGHSALLCVPEQEGGEHLVQLSLGLGGHRFVAELQPLHDHVLCPVELLLLVHGTAHQQVEVGVNLFGHRLFVLLDLFQAKRGRLLGLPVVASPVEMNCVQQPALDDLLCASLLLGMRHVAIEDRDRLPDHVHGLKPLALVACRIQRLGLPHQQFEPAHLAHRTVVAFLLERGPFLELFVGHLILWGVEHPLLVLVRLDGLYFEGVFTRSYRVSVPVLLQQKLRRLELLTRFLIGSLDARCGGDT
mmetsp:Transcript_109494/g.317755  ORF Transcript_109494/g.317755 Transcript_109494/m.317755 type:complete len:302 (+) Transcript_109494:1378-2283(+)